MVGIRAGSILSYKNKACKFFMATTLCSFASSTSTTIKKPSYYFFFYLDVKKYVRKKREKNEIRFGLDEVLPVLG
jgi:hypothetical protein